MGFGLGLFGFGDGVFGVGADGGGLVFVFDFDVFDFDGFEESFEGFAFSDGEVEFLELALLVEFGLEGLGSFAGVGGHHGDFAVDFGFVDGDVVKFGGFVEDEEEPEFGLCLCACAFAEFFDVIGECFDGYAASDEVGGAALDDASFL